MQNTHCRILAKQSDLIDAVKQLNLLSYLAGVRWAGHLINSLQQNDEFSVYTSKNFKRFIYAYWIELST